MKKNFTYIANWKMNKSFSESIEFSTTHMDDLINLTKTFNSTIILCPDALSIHAMSKIFPKEAQIYTGAQDCSQFSRGEFTGQIMAQSLSEAGAKFCLAGHSETRKYVDSQAIAQKALHLMNFNITPVICIDDVQDNIIETIASNAKGDVYVAYEPTWAIGTGKVASKDFLEKIFYQMAQKTQKFNHTINWTLLYGGSVNGENVRNLKTIEYLDGFLIGKSSLNFQDLKKIVECQP